MDHTHFSRAGLTTLAVTTLLVALVPLTARQARAQQIADIFSGTNTPGATAVTANATVMLGDTETATIGPGFATTVSLPLGVLDSLTATINPANAPGTFSLANSGLTGIGGTFSADKLFSTTSLSGGMEYQFQLTKTTATAISLLSALNVTISAGGTPLVNTSNGGNLLTLFGGGNTATLTFTTPPVLTNNGPLEIAVSGGTTAALLGNSVVFTGASFAAVVPEPGSVAATLVGVSGLMMVRWHRRRGMAEV